jgi:hypothetical protein
VRLSELTHRRWFEGIYGIGGLMLRSAR